MSFSRNALVAKLREILDAGTQGQKLKLDELVNEVFAGIETESIEILKLRCEEELAKREDNNKYLVLTAHYGNHHASARYLATIMGTSPHAAGTLLNDIRVRNPTPIMVEYLKLNYNEASATLLNYHGFRYTWMTKKEFTDSKT